MKKLKKPIIFMLAAVLALSVLSGCNGDRTSGPDRSELRIAVTAANGLNPAFFMIDSWEIFYEARGAAIIVLNDPNATQAQVDAALAALNQARRGLVDAFIREGPLTDLIEEYQNDLNERDFSTDSWAAFAEVLRQSTRVNQTAASSEAQLEAAFAALFQAFLELDPVIPTVDFQLNPVAPSRNITGMDASGNIHPDYVRAPGSFGVEGATSLRYIIGDDGLYLFLEVRDRTLFFGREVFADAADENSMGLSSFIQDSDRIEIFLSTGDNDLRSDLPQSTDVRVRVTAQGVHDVSVGNGLGSWSPLWGFQLDRMNRGLLPGPNIFTQRGTALEVSPPSMDSVDTGYWVELFFSYERFNFERRDVFHVAFAQADFVNMAGSVNFNGIGNVSNPQEFFMLSEFGLGTDVQLEADFNRFDLNDPFWNFAVTPNHYTAHTSFRKTTARYHGNSPSSGIMTVDARARFGELGLYIAIATEQQRIVYGGPNNGLTGFGWRNDHVELRIDTNLTRQEDTDVDLFFFVDIASNRLVMRGISNLTRTPGMFNHVLAMTYFGTVVDPFGNVVREGSNERPQGFLFKIFLSFEVLSVTPEEARTRGIGLFAAAGNPGGPGGAAGVGCVIGNYTIRQNGVGNLDEVSFNAWDQYFNLRKA